MDCWLCILLWHRWKTTLVNYMRFSGHRIHGVCAWVRWKLHGKTITLISNHLTTLIEHRVESYIVGSAKLFFFLFCSNFRGSIAAKHQLGLLFHKKPYCYCFSHPAVKSRTTLWTIAGKQSSWLMLLSSQ